MFVEFMTLDDYQQHKHELLADGWNNHHNSCDASVAHENDCIYCNSRFNYYEGFRRGSEYLAFMVCPDCKTVYPF